MACATGLLPPRVLDGRAFNLSKCGSLTPGMSVDQVRSVLGEPLSTRTDGTTESWRYFVRVRETETRELFGLIPMPPGKHEWSAEAVLKIQDGTVQEVVCPERGRD